MSDSELTSPLSAHEFGQLVARALPSLLPNSRLLEEPRLGARLRPDFVAYLLDGSVAIIEVKSQMPATGRRLASAADELREYFEAYVRQHGDESSVLRVLAVPGKLTQAGLEFLRTQGVDSVIDGPMIRRALDRQDDDVDGLAEPEAEQPTNVRAEAHALLGKLERIKPGSDQWQDYQKLCGSMLEFLFCPPLESPIVESRNETGVNRRDIILPNYTLSGFWAYMRETYSAHYIVADAKNYSESVRKDEILQLANYLSRHGTGLFGLIITRHAGAESARITRREQWFMHDKLIVELTDEDLHQMTTNKLTDRDPTEVLRQRIEDFRLGF
jgi:hypothetical protein